MVIAIKSKKGSDKSLVKSVIIVLEVALLLTVVVITIGVLSSEPPLSKEETSFYVLQDVTEDSTAYSVVNNDGVKVPSTNKAEGYNTDNGGVINNQGYIQNDNVPYFENSTVNKLPDPSGWSTAQIVTKAKEAVNKTKAYSGDLTVNHSESFSAEVTECSAGGIVRSVVDLMIGWVVKPVEETLVYQNGKAVNSEGETVPIILPKKNNFTLTEDGVKSASIQRVGDEYVIKINLIEESVGMYDVPKHNAASIGYLDVANFDISFMEVDSADIVYKGSGIELRINAEGYVTYANYNIPLHIDGSAHKGSISGSATFEGGQTEVWTLNY